MVAGLLASAARVLARDLGGLKAALSAPPGGPPPGLHTYRIEAHGGWTTLHLRIEPGGALLFIDASDVLYLSESAAHHAYLALERVPVAQAVARLAATWRGVRRAALARDYREMQARIERLMDPRERCRSCAVSDGRLPVFTRRAQAPFKADLALTYACQNACPHCYNEPTHLGLRSLSTEAWLEVIDRLVLEVGVPHLILTGGEATLHPDLLAIVAHARARGALVGLNTNGRRLGKGGLARSLYEAGLAHVQVTLESHRPEVHDAMVGAGAFHDTVAGVRAALDAGLSVLTNTTLTEANADAIEATLTFLHGLGLRTVALNAIIRSGGGVSTPDALDPGRLAATLAVARDRAAALGVRLLWYTVTDYCELSPVELELGPRRCNAGEFSICVEPNGDVLPCQSAYVRAGNLLRDPWPAIWDGDLFRAFREREARPELGGLREKCRACPDLPLCGGGCRLEWDRGFGARAGGRAGSARGGRSSGTSAVVRLGEKGGARC